MEITPLKLEGAFLIKLAPRTDSRGYFMRTWDEAIFASHGLTGQGDKSAAKSSFWVQENESANYQKGTLRGLHFQTPPASETKLVRAIVGAVYDVIVDLRKDSPTFAQWVGVELSADNHHAIYVPRGFAHGYCTLTDHATVLYKVDNPYAPAHDAGLRWNDPDLAIAWPAKEPVLSPKDQGLPLLRELQSPF